MAHADKWCPQPADGYDDANGQPMPSTSAHLPMVDPMEVDWPSVKDGALHMAHSPRKILKLMSPCFSGRIRFTTYDRFGTGD